MPKFTILLMPFALVGILEMRGWSHHLAPEPGVSQSFREQNAGAPPAIFCQLPPQPGAGQKIAPGHEIPRGATTTGRQRLHGRGLVERLLPR